MGRRACARRIGNLGSEDNLNRKNKVNDRTLQKTKSAAPEKLRGEVNCEGNCESKVNVRTLRKTKSAAPEKLRGEVNREGRVNIRTLQKAKSAAPEKLRGKVKSTRKTWRQRQRNFNCEAKSTSAPFEKRRVRHPKNVEAKAKQRQL